MAKRAPQNDDSMDWAAPSFLAVQRAEKEPRVLVEVLEDEPQPMEEGEDDPMAENEEEEEDDDYETGSKAAKTTATATATTAGQKKPSASKAKRMRRRGVIYCRHGCGFKFVSPSAQGNKKGPTDRKLRDQFDYHEQQQCPMLPRLVCPLECQYRGKVLSFAGPKALRQHFKTKSHQRAIELREQPVDLTRPVLEADYAPERVHGNPREHGFRKKGGGGGGASAAAAPKRRPKRRKAVAKDEDDEEEEEEEAAPDPTEYVTVDVDVLMGEPVDVLGMAPPPSASDASSPHESHSLQPPPPPPVPLSDQTVFARSSRTLEKMQRVMALGALASRRLTPDSPAVVVEAVREAPAKAQVAATTLTARQIKTVFRGLRFA